MTTQQGFYPNDLDLLKRVFDRVCAEIRCQPGSPAAEGMAVTLVHLFQSGRTTEEELLTGARRSIEFRLAS